MLTAYVSFVERNKILASLMLVVLILVTSLLLLSYSLIPQPLESYDFAFSLLDTGMTYS